MQYVDVNKRDKIHLFPTKLLKNIYLKQFENLCICTDAIYINISISTYITKITKGTIYIVINIYIYIIQSEVHVKNFMIF